MSVFGIDSSEFFIFIFLFFYLFIYLFIFLLFVNVIKKKTL